MFLEVALICRDEGVEVGKEAATSGETAISTFAHQTLA
jgi:hypothetical protein